jgi:hypothetical protein
VDRDLGAALVSSVERQSAVNNRMERCIHGTSSARTCSWIVLCVPHRWLHHIVLVQLPVLRHTVIVRIEPNSPPSLLCFIPDNLLSLPCFHHFISYIWPFMDWPSTSIELNTSAQPPTIQQKLEQYFRFPLAPLSLSLSLSVAFSHAYCCASLNSPNRSSSCLSREFWKDSKMPIARACQLAPLRGHLPCGQAEPVLKVLKYSG